MNFELGEIKSSSRAAAVTLLDRLLQTFVEDELLQHFEGRDAQHIKNVLLEGVPRTTSAA